MPLLRSGFYRISAEPQVALRHVLHTCASIFKPQITRFSHPGSLAAENTLRARAKINDYANGGEPL
jgi:hypothetical protein